MDTLTIVIIAAAVIVLIIISIIVYLCIRKKSKSDIKNNEEQVEIEVQVQNKPATLKQFIKVEDNKNKIQIKDISGVSGTKDSGLFSMSVTDRKLLNPASNDIFLKDSWDETKNEKERNVSILEASFRNDLYKIDPKDDKIRNLTNKNNNHDKDESYNENEIEEDKIPKDFIAENINNYTDGNRADFYSEAADENYNDEPEVEVEMNYNYYNVEASSAKEKGLGPKKKFSFEEDALYNNKKFSSGGNSPSDVTKPTIHNKNIEQEMTPEEHSDFLFEDIDVDDDEYEYKEEGDDQDNYNQNKYNENNRYSNIIKK